MSFSIQLTPDVSPAEAGATTPISVVVVNQNAGADRYEMEIEGIDPEWKAVPVPIFSVDPGESRTERVFFKPPRASESLAGSYPYVVRVRSLESGESRTVQGVLQVNPFNHLTMEISPKKGFISPARKQNDFDVTILNLGNTEHTLQLLGSDPEDSCAYDFEQEQVTVAPGQQRDVELQVNPTNTPYFSGAHLIGFSITGRSVDTPSVLTSSQAQLEQRSILSPTTLIVGVLFALIIGAWLLMMPKPPTIQLSVDPSQAQRGDMVKVTWSAERASRIVIKLGDNTVYDGPDLKGTRDVTLDQSGLVSLVGLATKDGNQGQETRTVTVAEPVPVPPPTILTFSADKDRVKLGESFILRYHFGESVSRAVLQPLGNELDLALNELEISPKTTGVTTYTVVAMNKKGETTQKTIKVNVVEESSASVPVFRAEPADLTEPQTRTTLSWLVTGAVQTEISYNGQTLTVDSSGPMAFEINSKTTFTLTAYDNKGRSVTKKITVDYHKQALPPTEPDVVPPLNGNPPTVDTGTTSTGTTGGLR